MDSNQHTSPSQSKSIPKELVAIAQILTDIFKVVGHDQQEAENMTEIFVGKIFHASLVAVIESKPVEQKEKFIKHVQDIGTDVDSLKEEFSELLQTEDLDEVFAQATEAILGEYFLAVKNDLSTTQIEKIQEILDRASRISSTSNANG